jgi:3'-phosphoadenosine 5'-phosphosulfate sulfotransferase (PAPS reductase)/FAD synthetase
MTYDGRSRYREPEPTLELGFVDDVPIEHDPLNPHPEHPTPIELVVRLTRPEREKRVERLVDLARRRYEEAVQASPKTVAGVCALRSGGNDSEAITHLFRDVATHHVHANTGTGIEATREFVRSTAAAAGIPLIERSPKPGQGYRDLVLGNVYARSRTTGDWVQAWPGGFPGPAAHRVMYQRLKERSLEQVPHDFGISGSRTERILFIAGRRRSESKVRSTVPHYDSRGTVDWVSPIAVWHKADLRAYRLMNPDIATNETAVTLGMSGECGCLANATAGEADRWRAAYPNDPFIREVDEMERLLAPRTDIPEHRKKWGWGGTYDEPDVIERIDGLCGVNCGPDPLLDLMDPLFELESEWVRPQKHKTLKGA